MLKETPSNTSTGPSAIQRKVTSVQTKTQSTTDNTAIKVSPTSFKEAPDFSAKAAPQLTSSPLPLQLKHRMEALSGQSLEDVRVHYNSQAPAQLSAQAFARGNEIHLGPGQKQHLPHEAWHVVQQKQGRVAPTTQLKSAAVNDDSGLEKEADIMGSRALEKGNTMMTTGPGQPNNTSTSVIQGKFLVDAQLSPEVGTQETEVPASDIHLMGIALTDKERPATRLGDKQGSHVIAWSVKVAYWKKVLKDISLNAALDQLLMMAQGDNNADAAIGEQGKTGLDKRHTLTMSLTENLTATKTPADWNRYFNWALTTYIEAYQLSGFSTMEGNSTNASEHLKLNALQVMDTQDQVNEDKVADTVMGMVDYPFTFNRFVYLKLFADLKNLCFTFAPNIFGGPHGEAILDKIALKIRPNEERKDMKLPEHQPDQDKLVEDDPEQSRHTLTSPFLATGKLKYEDTKDSALGMDEVYIDRLIVSNQRPNTRFKNRQMSHTISWCLERLNMTNLFTDLSVKAAVKYMKEFIEAENQSHTGNDVKEGRTILGNYREFKGSKKDILFWTNYISHQLQLFVKYKQKSYNSVYGTEVKDDGTSTARSNGEASAMTYFKSKRADELDSVNVKRHASRLLELPFTNDRRDEVDMGRLRDRYIGAITNAFPDTEPFAQDLEDMFNDKNAEAELAAKQRAAYMDMYGRGKGRKARGKALEKITKKRKLNNNDIEVIKQE